MGKRHAIGDVDDSDWGRKRHAGELREDNPRESLHGNGNKGQGSRRGWLRREGMPTRDGYLICMQKMGILS